MYFFCSWVMDWQNDILEKIKILFRGIGQVMFQNNAWSGVLMLAGIACNSLYMAGLALLGTVVSTSTARIAGYSCEDIRNGLYGFNGTLVGIAVGVFMNISVWAFMLLIIGAALSTWVMRLFQRQRFVPGYTAPFILVTWLLLLLERTVFPSLEALVRLRSRAGAGEYRFFKCSVCTSDKSCFKVEPFCLVCFSS